MKYIINDNEGGNFGCWSHERPATRKEIIYHFKELSDRDDLRGGENELIPVEQFTLKLIQDIWNVEILPIKAG
jgi:hypothetical protein